MARCLLWLLGVASLAALLIRCHASTSSVPSAWLAALAKDLFVSRAVGTVFIFNCVERDTREAFRALAGTFRTRALLRPGSRWWAGDADSGSRTLSAVLVPPACLPMDNASSLRLHEGSAHNSSFLWLLPEALLRDVAGAPLRFDSDVVIARRRPETTTGSARWDLIDVYRENPTDGPSTEAAGSWSDREGLTSDWEPRLQVRRADLTNVKVKTVLFLKTNQSHDFVSRMPNQRKEDCLKLTTMIAMHSHIMFVNTASRFNMSVTFLTHTSSGGLTRQSDGTFSGTVGMLERGDADVMSTGLFVYASRMSVLEFPVPTIKFRAMFVFLAPSAFGSADALWKPLMPSTWAAVGVVWAAVSVFDNLINILEKQRESAGSSLVKTIGSLTGQGFIGLSRGSAVRVLFLTFEVFCFMVSGYYSSAIVKFLLRPPPSKVRTVFDLVRSPLRGAADNWFHNVRVLTQRISCDSKPFAVRAKYFVGKTKILAVVAKMIAVHNSTDPLIRLAYDRYVRPPVGLGFLQRGEAIAALRHSPTALYGEDNVIYEAARVFQDGEVCRLKEIDVMPKEFHSFGLRKQIPFKEHIRSGMLIQIERGITSRETDYWLTRKPVCSSESSSTTAVPVEFMPLLPAFSLLSCGLLLAGMLLLTERMVRRRRLQKPPREEP